MRYVKAKEFRIDYFERDGEIIEMTYNNFHGLNEEGPIRDELLKALDDYEKTFPIFQVFLVIELVATLYVVLRFILD